MLIAVATEILLPLSSGKLALVAKPLSRVKTVMASEIPTRDVRAEDSAEDLMLAVAEKRDRESFAQLFERFGPRVTPTSFGRGPIAPVPRIWPRTLC